MPDVRYSEDTKKYYRQYQREMRAERKAAGVCPCCCKKPEEGFIYCADYRAKRRKYYNSVVREKHQRRVSQGRCSACGKGPLIPGHRENQSGYGVCATCYMKLQAHRHLGSRKFWKILLTKLIEQKYRCAYTGQRIILGVNASIDHIVPRIQDPSLAKDPQNLEWVLFNVNQMKSGRTKPEFLELINQIHYHYLPQES